MIASELLMMPASLIVRELDWAEDGAVILMGIAACAEKVGTDGTWFAVRIPAADEGRELD